MRQRLLTPEVVLGICSILLAAVAVTRATSYYFRPPDPAANPGAAVIEAGIGYDRWVWVLLACAALVLVGTLTPAWPLRFAGHLIGLFAYSIFALSIIYAAIHEGDGWNSVGAVAYVAVAHAALVMFVGLSHGRR